MQFLFPQKSGGVDKFLLEFIFSKLVLKYILYLYHIPMSNVVIFLCMLYQKLFIIFSKKKKKILVVSVNLRLFQYCIISTVFPHFGNTDMFYSLDIILS